MHTRTVDAKDRFRHEGGMQVVLGRNRFHHPFRCDGIVGGLQGIGIFEIDLVLPLSDLVMGASISAHLFKRLDDLAPTIIGSIFRIK